MNFCARLSHLWAGLLNKRRVAVEEVTCRGGPFHVPAVALLAQADLHGGPESSFSAGAGQAGAITRLPQVSLKAVQKAFKWVGDRRFRIRHAHDLVFPKVQKPAASVKVIHDPKQFVMGCVSVTCRGKRGCLCS